MPSAVDREATGSAQRGTLRTIFLCVAGWLVGYLISAISSLLIFVLGHVDPEAPTPVPVMLWVAIFGVLFSGLSAAAGASFCRGHALPIGAAIALTTGAVALWSWSCTPNRPHWTQLIAIILMAPAAQFGALFRRLDY